MQKTDPGAARFGNFINYYDFNPAVTRSKLLEESLTEHVKSLSGSEPLLLLDVGCNVGDLSLELFRIVSSATEGRREVHMLAVDLDPLLIERANEKITDPLIQFSTVDVSDSRQRESIIDSFLKSRGRCRFDFVFCFSTTMWVHLNHGDKALISLLETLSNYGENLVIEPQPWKCYRNAMRRMRRTKNDEFPLFDELRFRSHVIDDIMNILTTKCASQLVKHLGQSDWDRPILWYRSA